MICYSCFLTTNEAKLAKLWEKSSRVSRDKRLGIYRVCIFVSELGIERRTMKCPVETKYNVAKLSEDTHWPFVTAERDKMQEREVDTFTLQRYLFMIIRLNKNAKDIIV